MPEAVGTLFPDTPEEGTSPASRTTGILPYQAITQLVRGKAIAATTPIEENQVQPASIDLRLGEVAYRVRASFLPGPEATVQEKIERVSMHKIDLSPGAVLERGCVYIVPLMEHVNITRDISGLANPKSSIGRLNIFTRLITDHATVFDRVAPSYRGPLYAEISPCAFSVLVRKGSRLNQLRLRRGSPPSSAAELRKLIDEARLVDAESGKEKLLDGAVPLTVDLKGESGSGLIGFKAKKHTGIIDVDKVNHYEPLDFWEPIYAQAGAGIILDPDDFYILASKQKVTVPPTHAAELVAYDTLMGEFRVHYAGFFDPGFGYVEGRPLGAQAVLEVRSHEVPFVIEDGQIVGRLLVEPLMGEAAKLYGPDIGSSYQRQGLALSKHFKPFAPRP